MRNRLLAVFSLLILSPALARGQHPDARGDRFQGFIDAAIRSPTPLVLGVAGGVIDQLSDFPEEWGGAGVVGTRTAARLGSGLASDAIGHSVAALIHHRVPYDPCQCRGFARVGHAMKRTLVSVRDGGGAAPNYSLWVAKFSAAGLANAWYPDSYQRDDIVREGFVGIAVAGGLNVLREFAPELLKLNPFR
jgi:hypothetical protein